MCTEDPLPLPGDTERFAGYMRIMGIILINVSVIEFGVGGAAYSFLSIIRIGGWWSGIVPCIAAVFAILSNNRCVVIVGCVFAVIGIIIAVIAAIIDGAQATTMNNLTGCINTATGDTYGSTSGIAYATACYTGNSEFNYYGSSNSQCVCADSSQDCYGYTMKWDGDCDELYTTYYDELSASCAFCSILAGLCLIYSILTCEACCCPNPVPPNVNATNANVIQNTSGQPISVQYVIGQPQPMYINPAGGQPQTILMYASAPPAPGVSQQHYYQPATIAVSQPVVHAVAYDQNAKY